MQITNIISNFSRGQRLKSSDLNTMQKHLMEVGSALLRRYSNGILWGLEADVEAGKNVSLSPGGFKINGQVGFIECALPLEFDFLGIKKLVLSQGDEKDITEPSYFQTSEQVSSDSVKTATQRTFHLEWIDCKDCEQVPKNHIELLRIHRTEGPSFYTCDTTEKIEQGEQNYGFEDLNKWAKQTNSLPANNICHLFSQYAVKGKWAGPRPVFQNLIARTIKENGAGNYWYFALPALFQGEFPLCDYYGTSNLGLALRNLVDDLSGKQNNFKGESDVPVDSGKSPGCKNTLPNMG